MAAQKKFLFERATQEFDTYFDYTFQEGPNINLLNITLIKS